jgi:hypothetical protein
VAEPDTLGGTRMGRLSLDRGALLLLASGILSCSEPTEGCTGDVELSVTGSSVPSFSWVPDCAVTSLTVEDGGGESLWEINARVGQNTIESPVRFGQVPGGADETVPPGGLLRDNTYIVRVFRVFNDNSGNHNIFSAGEEIFPW